MPEGTKYDSVTESLKLTQVEYNCEISALVLEASEGDEIDILHASTGQVRNWMRDRLADHEWFEEFDGATFGAIIEFAAVDAGTLTRWHCQGDAASALQTMAEEAMIEDVLAEVREHQENIREMEVPADAE